MAVLAGVSKHQPLGGLLEDVCRSLGTLQHLEAFRQALGTSMYSIFFFRLTYFFACFLKRIYFQRKLCIPTRSRLSTAAAMCRGCKISAVTGATENPSWAPWAAIPGTTGLSFRSRTLARVRGNWKMYTCQKEISTPNQLRSKGNTKQGLNSLKPEPKSLLTLGDK